MPARYLYLARHGEPDADGDLTDRGVEQAAFLGNRLSKVPLTSVLHGPLPRASQTAHLVAERLASTVPVDEAGCAGDYVPHVPPARDVDPGFRAGVLAFLADVSSEDATRGEALAAEAIRVLAGPAPGPAEREQETHSLVVTHTFTIGWLVRHAYGAPPWRWVGVDHGHAALTVLRYASDRPPTVMVFNDMSHLPVGLRWTGFPAETMP